MWRQKLKQKVSDIHLKVYKASVSSLLLGLAQEEFTIYGPP